MKQLLTLLGLVLAIYCHAQINTPQLLYQAKDSEQFAYFYSEDERHLFFVEENKIASDIQVLKENGSLWKTISAENMEAWHYTTNALEFVQSNGDKRILATVVETSDPSSPDYYYSRTYDVINDTLFSNYWPRVVSETYFAKQQIREDGEFKGTALINLNTGQVTDFPDVNLKFLYWEEKYFDFFLLRKFPDDLYVIDDNLQLLWIFSDEDYSILGHWKDEQGAPFIMVRDINGRVQVFDESDNPIRGHMAGDSILFSHFDVYKSEQLGYIGVNKYGIYELDNFKLKATFPGSIQTILSSNNKPYFLTENVMRDSFYLYDENADLVHSFAQPPSLLNVNIDELYPSMHFFNGDRTIEFLQRLPQSSRLINEYNEILWEIPVSGIYLNGTPEFQYHKDVHVLYYKYNREVYELPKIIDGEEYEFVSDPEPPIPPQVMLNSEPHLVPNPFITETSIQGLDFPFSVYIYASDGKKIHSRIINSAEENTLVNLEFLAKGIYYFEVEQLGKKTGLIGLKW